MQTGPRSHRMLHLFVIFLAAQYISFVNGKAGGIAVFRIHE